MLNASPEPVTNATASIAEDLAVIGGLWTALNYPLAFVAFIIVFVLFAIWLLPKLWRAIKDIVSTLRGWFGKKTETSVVADSQTDIIENLIEAKAKKISDE